MKLKLVLLCGCLTMSSLTLPAMAVDSYFFATVNPEEFYQDGSIYTSQHGVNIIAPELDSGFGMTSVKPINAPGSPVAANINVEAGSSSYGLSDEMVLYPEVSGGASNTYALTAISDVRQSDGSIGTLAIPAIGLTVTAYDGEVTAAMKSGVGHMDATSCWLGNIGLVGHNRGVNEHFGKLGQLKAGDTITYTTSLGTRAYTVTFVGKIAATDWSLLQYTADNRMTLITCINDQPDYRLAVQAVEKK